MHAHGKSCVRHLVCVLALPPLLSLAGILQRLPKGREIVNLKVSKLEFVDRVRSFLSIQKEWSWDGYVDCLFVCCRLGVLTLLVEGSELVCSEMFV